MPLTLNYRPRADDPSRDPLREIVGRLALACVGLILAWLAFRGFAFARVIIEKFHLDHRGPRKEEVGLFPLLLYALSGCTLAFGGLTLLGAILPSAAFWRLLATDDPRTRRLRDAVPGPSFDYAVLHHTGVDPEHYDVLFETSPTAPLATFRSPHWPLTARTVLERLPDHRRAYLTYEGPISDNRGQVRRVASGTAEHRVWSRNHIMLALHPQDVRPADDNETMAGAPRRKHPAMKAPPVPPPPAAIDLYLMRRPDNTWLVASVGQNL